MEHSPGDILTLDNTRNLETMEKTTILIVEDENIVALDIRNRLKKLGYSVAGRAVTGKQAVDQAVNIHPDLVLMDIRLKGEMDGVTAAAHIRSQIDIPVVYLTAYSDDVTLQRAKVTEPYGYIIKPFEDRDLHSAISMALYRHKAERELKESRQWLATTLKSIGDAVIATDNQGRIKYMNPVAEDLTGWTQIEAVGKDSREIFNIINASTRHTTPSPVYQALEQNRIVQLEDNTLLISKAGQEIPVDDSAAPIIDDNGEVYGAVLVFRDITDRKIAEEKLKQFTQELQAQNAELDAFSHTVAHDLKSPLNPLIGFANVLADDFDTLPKEEIKEFLDIIVQNSLKISTVVDELLLLAHTRKADVAVKPLWMSRILDEVRDRLEYMIKDYQAELTIPDEWPDVIGYAPWIEQVWVNYITNGLKYGGQPPRLVLGADRQADGFVRFWVKDNGPGLSRDDQAKLFAPFTQLEQVRAAGHGLGLSIVRRIVNKLGGQVGVESENLPGKGCTFFFTLPEQVQQIEELMDDGEFDLTLLESMIVSAVGED